MADGRDFGKIINERRLELGYSLGQLATRMGTTATQVRSWERGNDVPGAEVVAKLASELDLDHAELTAALATPEPDAADEAPEEATASVMAPMFSDASDTAAAVVDEAPAETADEAAVAPDAESDVASGGDDTELETADAVAPEALGAVPVVVADAADAPTTEDAAAPSDEAVPPADTDGEGDVESATAVVAASAPAPAQPPATEDRSLADLPTEAVPVVPPPMPEPAVASQAMAAPATGAVVTAPPPQQTYAPVEQPTGPLAPVEKAFRTLFDPDKRYLFWLRTALILVVFLVFLRVLAWAVPEFFDALAEILDTIESTPTDTTSFLESG